jgi:peptidoglycan/LPS O-acetylase OafA/YrhL
MVGRREPLNALTTLRFFAAFRVMLYHAVAWDRQSFWLRGLMATPIGVSYFFVSSGFLLTYTYADRPIALREFWTRRAERILPVYYLGLVVAIPMLIATGGISLGRVVATLALVQAWNPRTALYWNFPAWALSALAFFYFALPFALRITTRMSSRRILVLSAIVWALSVVSGLVYAWLRPDGLASVTLYTRADWLNVLKFNPLLRLPEFLLGVCAGQLFRRWGGFGPRAVRIFSITVVALAAALLLVQLLPYPVANSGCMDPLLAIVLVCLATDNAVTRFFSRPVFVRLGQSSFCLYMVHAPLLSYAQALLPASWRHRPVYLLATIPTIVFIALALYTWIEAPISAALRRRRSGAQRHRQQTFAPGTRPP